MQVPRDGPRGWARNPKRSPFQGRPTARGAGPALELGPRARRASGPSCGAGRVNATADGQGPNLLVTDAACATGSALDGAATVRRAWSAAFRAKRNCASPLVPSHRSSIDPPASRVSSMSLLVGGCARRCLRQRAAGYSAKRSKISLEPEHVVADEMAVCVVRAVRDQAFGQSPRKLSASLSASQNWS
jgi:hypothetical protein